jgi:hypothetical protein
MARGIRPSRGGEERTVIVLHAFAQPFALSKLVGERLDGCGLFDVLPWRATIAPDPRLMEHTRSSRSRVIGPGPVEPPPPIFPEIQRKQIDIFHVRYNAAHRGAEKEVFEHLPEEGGPGVVAFTSNRWGSLIDPAWMPAGEPPPSPADCYRFVLSHPKVHVACSGPSSMKQLEQNLLCLEQGPMNAEELERMRRIGRYVYEKGSPWRAQLQAMMGVLTRPFRRKSSLGG